MEVLAVITGVQILAIIFSLLMLYVSFLHFKKEELSFIEFSFFVLIWLGAIFLTIFPKSVNFILQTFQIYRLLDLATIIGFMIFSGLIFRNYLEIKKLKKKIEKIVQEKALKNLKSK